MMKITKLSLCVSMVGLLATLPAAYANEIVTNCTQVSAVNGVNGVDTNTANNESCAKLTIPFDYGDAPDPAFNTLDANGGARHQLGTNVFLGKCVDGDTGLLQGGSSADDADKGSPEYGDCSNTSDGDEDGVAIAELRVGDTKNVVQVTAKAACKLNAWVDWNGDGSWASASDQVFTDKVLVAGLNALTMDVPLFAQEGSIHARFRCSSAGGDGIGGEAADGEVEDYKLTILPAIPNIPVSVGNYIWIDADNNGTQDKGETALAGATVTLLDAAGNPVNDLDGKPVKPVITDLSGKYLFSNLAEGDYSVTVTPPTGYIVTKTGTDADVDTNPADTDNNCAANATGNTTLPFTLSAGGEPDTAADGDDSNGNMTVDCGFYKPKAPTHSIGNTVWVDDGAGDTTKANNGKRDATELPVADGVVMELLDSNGIVLTTTATKNGYYLFSGLEAGKYSVCVAHGNFDLGILKGYTASTGGDEVDANTDGDNNDNGENDTQNGLCSNLIILDDKEPIGETPTASGTAGDDGMGTVDSRSNLTVDFGVLPPKPVAPGTPVAVGNLIWIDSNADGKRDDSESPLAGATVTLTNASGAAVTDMDGKPVNAHTTGKDGIYLFSNLPEGNYIVKVEPPKGFFLTTGGIDADDDSSDYDSNCRINPLTNAIETHPFTLKAGTEPDTDGDDTNGNMTVDCGFYSPVSLGNRIWLDENANGQQDNPEPGVAGVTVQLLEEDGITPATDINGKPVAPVITPASGNYLFNNLKPGNYIVTVKPKENSGYSLTKGGADPDTAPSDTDSNCKVVAGSFQTPAVTLSPGGEPDTKVDGDDTNGNLTVDCGLIRPVNLGSRLWIDLNADGKQDAGEPGVPGATVTLLTVDGQPVTDIFGEVLKPQTTGANGEYFFGNLREGSYVVKVKPPAGYLPTINSDGYLTADGSIVSKPIDLKATNNPIGFNPIGLVRGDPAAVHVPTLSQWSVALMSMLLATVAFFRRRRED